MAKHAGEIATEIEEELRAHMAGGGVQHAKDVYEEMFEDEGLSLDEVVPILKGWEQMGQSYHDMLGVSMVSSAWLNGYLIGVRKARSEQ